MNRIYFPHMIKGDFNNLRGAYRTLHQPNYGWDERQLIDIVQYNICFRDYLRKNGVKNLVDMMCENLPELVQDEASLKSLYGWTVKTPLADYDVQCYLTNAEINILGHVYCGIDDIRRSVELECRIGVGNELNFRRHNNSRIFGEVHVGLFSKAYPIFDYFDIGDDRTFQNYIFSRDSLSEVVMRKVYDTTPKDANTQMVHERIPEENLPILWYQGDGRYMILASAK